MIRVGLTGGIGSGKSTVADFFRALGVPVYDSDLRAKALMEQHGPLVQGIRQLLGPESFKGGHLDRPFIASRVFEAPELLRQLNALVHPVVREDFLAWSRGQKAPYVVQEAAILFENGGHRHLDRMILVTAPVEERIRRVMARDSVPREAVISRMKHQWPDADKIPLADFVIRNTDLETTRREVGCIHRELLEITGIEPGS